VGIGIDAVDIHRFRLVLARRQGLLGRIFTEGERDHSARRRDPAPSLAARFAAKEAVMKALGVGLGSFAFSDVEVITGAGGAPRLQLSGGAVALAESLGVTGWHLSLTHTDHLAEAVALAVRA